MMATAQTANRLVRDTTMCGDPKIWFPMRVTYSREMKVKGELERLEIENFVPMKYWLMPTQIILIASWFLPSTT